MLIRRLTPAVALAVLAVLPSAVAHAQDGPDPCTVYAAQAAMPSLSQSYAFTPSGYGPFGYAPLTYPFGVGPYGAAAFFGRPGLAPAFGPLGPGVTANAIARTSLGNDFNVRDPANVGTLTSLAGLQQAELGTINTRYSNSAYYQTAAATWAGDYATQAVSAFTILQAYCQNQPQRATAAAPMMASMMQSPTMVPMQAPMMMPAAAATDANGGGR